MIKEKSKRITRERMPTPPDLSLFPKMGKGAGYSLSEAINELADNSFDARSDEKLIINISFHWQGRHLARIVVEDNGRGMSIEKLRDAMILAKSSKSRGKLGEWGLGLKTGCLSVGRTFSVRTAEVDGLIYSTKYDDREWEKEKDWGFYFETYTNPRKWQGTIIEIRDFEMEIQKKQVKKFVQDLANSFQHMITSGSVKINVRDIVYMGDKQTVKTYLCEPSSLDFAEKKNFNILVMNGRISGFVGILKKPLRDGRYGFHTFRNKKMIEPFSKIGLHLARPEPSDRLICGQIHMDLVSTTHDKREWIVESVRYRKVDKAITALVKPLRIKAKDYEKSLLAKKKYKTLPYNLTYQVLRRVFKCFKESYAFNPALFTANSIKKSPFGNMSGVVKVEKRDKPEESVSQFQDREKQKQEGSKKRVPKKTRREDTYVVRAGDKRFSFEVLYEPRAPGEPWKCWEKIPSTGGIVLHVNTAHFLWGGSRTLADRERLLSIIISETISEIISGNKRLTEMRDSSIREFLRIFGN